MNNQLILCILCQDWSDFARMRKLCEGCNNSKLMEASRLQVYSCNKCGESLIQSNQELLGMVNLIARGGYHSEHLTDMTNYHFSLCELCLRNLFNSFKIKPLTNDPDNWSYQMDQEDYQYRQWKKAGSFNKAYLHRKCNQAIDCPNSAVYSIMNNDGNITDDCSCQEHKSIMYPAYNERVVDFIPQELRPFQ